MTKHKNISLYAKYGILIAFVFLSASNCMGKMKTINIGNNDFDCYTANNRLNDIAPSHDLTKVWCAGDGGLFLYKRDGTLLRSFTRKDGLACNNLREILLTPDNIIWLASLQGVMKYQNDTFTIFDKNTGLNDNRVYSLGSDENGRIYAGTHKGICVLKNNKFSPFDDTHEFARRSVLNIHRSIDGSMWFVKNNALSHFLKPKNWKIFQKDILQTETHNDIINNSLLCIATDSKGQPLIGTRLGLGHFKNGKWEKTIYKDRFTQKYDIMDNNIACLAIDSSDDIWIGHGDSKDYDKSLGLAHLKDDKWIYRTTENGLISDCIYRIRIDSDNRKWLATDEGGMCIDNTNITYYIVSNTLPANCISKIEKISDNTVSILAGNHLTIWENGKPKKNMNYADISGKKESKHNARKSISSRKNLPREIHRMNPRVIITDANKNQWICTAKHGLLRYDGESWAEILLQGRRAPAEITDLCFENEYILWVGTASEGAIRIKIPCKSDL